jgi:hypothetical protein
MTVAGIGLTTAIGGAASAEAAEANAGEEGMNFRIGFRTVWMVHDQSSTGTMCQKSSII